MNDLKVLRVSMLSIQVCTNATNKKDIERLTNESNLCGTTKGWTLDEDLSKRLNQSKVSCSDDPKRSHYILYA